jgi:hypothetical protein
MYAFPDTGVNSRWRKPLARRLADLGIGLMATVIAEVAPPSAAYAVLWKMLSIVFPILTALYAPFSLPHTRERWLPLALQRALAVMTRRRPGFDLRLRIEGEAELERALAREEPLILCTAHFALTLAAPRALAERGRDVVVIANASPQSDGWHWGLRRPLRILANGPDVLLRARTLLRHGETLICYVDDARKVAGSPRPISYISPNIFHLARRTGARILFLGSRLDPSGAIVINFHLPTLSRPTSACEADLAAAEFAAFASELLGWACVVRRPIGAGSENPDARTSAIGFHSR